MRRAWLLSLCVALGLGQWAGADILKMKTGDELRGTVQLVTIVVKDVQTIYPRDEVKALTIAKEGTDTFELRTEGKVEGKLVSLMFDAASGLRAVTRDKIESVTLDASTTMDSIKVQEKEATEKKEEAKDGLTAEAKTALLKNRDLYRGYLEAADGLKDEGYDAVKTKYMDRVRECVRDVQRLERSIQNKIQRREDASTRTYTSEGRTRMSERERLDRTDNLSQDQNDLERARASASKLKSVIRSEEQKVRDKTDQRKSRVETAYTSNRAKLFDGNMMTEEEMTTSYEAALRLPGEKPRSKTTTPKPAADPKPANKTKGDSDRAAKAREQGLDALKAE